MRPITPGFRASECATATGGGGGGDDGGVSSRRRSRVTDAGRAEMANFNWKGSANLARGGWGGQHGAVHAQCAVHRKRTVAPASDRPHDDGAHARSDERRQRRRWRVPRRPASRARARVSHCGTRLSGSRAPPAGAAPAEDRHASPGVRVERDEVIWPRSLVRLVRAVYHAAVVATRRRPRAVTAALPPPRRGRNVPIVRFSAASPARYTARHSYAPRDEPHDEAA